MNEQKLLKEIVAIRREIHQHPELGNNEFKTAKVIERVLNSLRIPHRRLTKTGILAEIKNGDGIGGPCLALRADMDALPLTETSKISYASKIPGVMHACGHDAHVAMLLGAAMLLKESSEFSGTVKLIFQPNEEGAGGAMELINKGVMKNPRVDATFGLHVNPRFPSGSVAIKSGPLMAAVDKFDMEIVGRGGHAAYPHEGRDAVAIASEIVMSLQTIVSRKVDPVDPAVLTVGTFNAGTRYNILAGKALLTGTVRTLSEKTHALIPKLIRETLDGITRAHGVKYVLNYEVLGSVLSNNKAIALLAKKSAEKILPAKMIHEPEAASMGGEDFSEYLKFSPGCFIYVGTGNAKLKTTAPWHHPGFNLDESALPVGSKLLAQIVHDFSNR